MIELFHSHADPILQLSGVQKMRVDHSLRPENLLKYTHSRSDAVIQYMTRV
jgi:hypothetical protein